MSKKQTAEEKLGNALSILDGVETVFEVQNEAIKITQFKFLESIKVLDILKNHHDSIPFDLLNETTDADQQIKNILTSAVEFGTALVEIIKIHLKKDDAWIDNLEIDEAVQIILAIIKANADFFTKTLLPKIPTSIVENFKGEKDS